VDLLRIGTSYSDVLSPRVIPDYHMTASLETNGTVRFAFPASALTDGFVVQTTSLPITAWTSGPTPTIEGDTAVLRLPASTAIRFYRLLRQ
jgi:hypothetical protein